jgi:iron complex outermembrane receptor protein
MRITTIWILTACLLLAGPPAQARPQSAPAHPEAEAPEQSGFIMNHPGEPVTAVSAAPIAGAGSLECRVTAPDGSPLAGARVTLVGRAGSLVADRDGRCLLDPVPEPPFTLLIARPDGVAIRPVTFGSLPASGALEITVEPAGKTITVVSDVIPDLEVPPGVASTIVGRIDLEQRQPQRLTDVLENLPGTNRTGEGHSVVPGLRGLPKHRTLILLDDGRVTAERRAGPSATFLNPESLDEIEVIRGPGCVAYGSDAFGGVIRARSRMPALDGSTRLRYSLMAGSNAREKGGSAEVMTGLLGGGVLLGVHYRDFDDYDSPEGLVLDSGAEERAVRLAYQTVIGNGVLHIGWRTDQARDVGKPAPDSDVQSTYYPEEDSHRFNLGYERPGPGSWSRLAFSLAWDSYSLVLDKDRHATADEPRRIDQSDVSANDYELRLEAERPLAGFRLVLGANAYGRFDLNAVNRTFDFDLAGAPTTTTSEVSVASARRDDIGIFVGLNRELGRWRLAAGLRGDRVSSRNNGGYFGDMSTSNSDLSGFFAVTYDLGAGFVTTGQVARGFRDALLSDRYYRGLTGRGVITGNPRLEPETSLQYDLSLRYDGSHGLRLAAYGFMYRIDDLIERYKDDGDYYYRNRGEAEVTGIELEAGLAMSETLELQLGAQYLRGEVRNDATPTDDVPAPGLFLVLRGEPSQHWWWMARVAAMARDDRPGPTEKEVPGHTVLDAGLGWSLNDALQLQLLGRNLLDRSYPGSADEEAVLAPGRSVQLVLRGQM